MGLTRRTTLLVKASEYDGKGSMLLAAVGLYVADRCSSLISSSR